jgi:hypothetical protein
MHLGMMFFDLHRLWPTELCEWIASVRTGLAEEREKDLKET